MDKQPSITESIGEAVEQELGSFVKLELVAEQMLADEMRLVRAYIDDDVGEAKTFWVELKSDFLQWEHDAGEWLLEAADPTPLDWLHLAQAMGHGDQVLMAGEVSCDCELVCMKCNVITHISGTATIAPCYSCGNEYFHLAPVQH